MATSMRGSVGRGKEKKLTPSTSSINRTPKSTSTPSNVKTNTTTVNSKSVPNYLRPTVSSTVDPNKAKHARTGSIEQPPPGSPVQRAVRASPTGGPKAQRSSSFSNKSTVSSPSSSSSLRPPSERLYGRTSSLKDRKVNPDLSKSRNVKKSNLSVSSKKEVMPNRKKGPKSLSSESSADCENRNSVDRLTFEEDLQKLDSHEVSLPEMSEMPDSNEELGDPTDVKEEIHHNDEEKSMVIDQVLQQNEGAGDQKDESVEKVVEVDPTVPTVEEVKEQVEVGPTEAKDESRTVSSRAVKTSQIITGGKKEKQDYNEVIEETATKLMGGKKNKVLALAGAFETVISLQ